MKAVTTDQKRRIVLPNAEPGEVYSVRVVAPGHLELTRMIPAPRQAKSADELRRILSEDALTPAISWDALKQQTREW